MLTALLILTLRHSTLDVGDGKSFARIEDALVAAQPGDTIRVWPSTKGYGQTALRLTKPRIRLEAATKIVLDGTGFDYSGSGSVPRAIIQFNPEATDCVVSGFTLRGAHNQSHNGAGVRINGAANATVERCEIEGNDMGIMSNGASATGQTIEHCHIHHNGSAEDPGYNHNLYLGGADVLVRFCEIDHALTGHDLKSRAHFTRVQGCYLHDSANREFDLVEAEETVPAHSNAALINNLVVRGSSGGNGNVIHFGREKGVHNGGIWLIGNTIVTTSSAPVLSLSDERATATLTSNVIVSKDQGRPSLLAFTNGSSPNAVTGNPNWISPVYGDSPLRMASQLSLPQDFWATFKVPGPSTKAEYEDGGGRLVPISTDLGYGGKVLWN